MSVWFPINAANLGSSTVSANQEAIDELQMRDVVLVPTVGVDDLSFVRHLRVTAAAASEPQTTTLIADYERPVAPDQAVLRATPAVPVDLLPLWRPKSTTDRTVRVALTVTGVLPATAWAIDGHFILSATLHN